MREVCADADPGAARTGQPGRPTDYAVFAVTSGIQVRQVTEKAFAYTEYRLELSNAPETADARGGYFQPGEMRVTGGRPGPPGRPDRGVEVELINLHPSPNWRSQRLRRLWSSDSYGDSALATADDWVQILAGKVTTGRRQPAGVLYALREGTGPVVAVLHSTHRISGTEWRIDLTDAPDTAGDGHGDFHPTALLVLRSNIMSDGGAFRTSAILVGTELAGSTASGLGKRWNSDGRGSYSFASTPSWVKALVLEHAGLDLAEVTA